MGYDELREIAEALGIPHAGEHTIELPFAGKKLEISLDINSGTVNGIFLRLRTHPMPELYLRREKPVDVEGKARGINREVQLGDPAFDSFVYIESDESHSSVQALFADPRHRKAIVALVGRCHQMRFDERGFYVTASSHYFSVDQFRVLADLCALLANLPVVEVSGPMPGSDRGTWVIGVSGSLLAAALVVILVAFARYPPTTFFLPLLGAALGLVLWVPLRWLLALHVRGHSTSFRRYRIAVWFVLVDAIALGGGLSVLLNGALDPNPPAHRHTKITAVQRVDGITDATLAPWSPGGPEVTMPFLDPTHALEVGDPADIQVGDGLFGFEWKTGVGRAQSKEK